MGKKARRKTPQRYHPPPQTSAPNDPGEPRAAALDSENEASLEQLQPKVDPDPKLPDDGPLKCRHLKRGLNLEKLDEKLTSLSAAALVCPACKKAPKAASGKKKKQLRRKKQEFFGSSSLWICLACGNVGCARAPDNEEPDEDHPFANGHALEHSRHLRHPLALQIGDALSIWCFECNSTIASQADLVNGLEALGSRGESLQKAVKVVQGSFFKKTSHWGVKNLQEAGGVLELQPERNGVVRGLMNLGNTCFFNSVMQNLVAIRGLREYFLSPATGLTEGEGPLTSALRRFYCEFTGGEVGGDHRSRERNTYNPKGLFGAICSKSSRFSGYQQQDSHELLRCLLDGLHLEEESARRGGESEGKAWTFVEKFFSGDLESTLTCCECGYSSSVLEPFHDLSLPIPVPEDRGGGSSGSAASTASAAPPSKRELKGKKMMMDRRKRGFMAKVPVEALREPLRRRQASDDSFWMDYCGGKDDFVDVSLGEPEPDLLETTDTSITTQLADANAASLQAPGASSSSSAAPEPQASSSATLEATDASTTTEVQSSTSPEASTGIVLVRAGPAAATLTSLQQAGDSVATQITKDELEKELLPLKEAAAPSGSDFTLVPVECDSEQKLVEEASVLGGGEGEANVLVAGGEGNCDAGGEGGGGGEDEGEVVPLPTSVEVDEALCSAPSVIALPYWGEPTGWGHVPEPTGWGYQVTPEPTGWGPEVAPEPTGWEIVPEPPTSGDSEGIGSLFQEEEEAVPVVLGCANRDGVGPDPNPAPVYEEPEDIVERSIDPMTLEGCLTAFTKIEVLTGDNAWECSNCTKQTEVSKKTNEDEEVIEVTSGLPEGGEDEDEWNAEKKKRKEKKMKGKGKAAGRSDKSKGCSPVVVLRNATKSLGIKRAPPVLTVHLKRFAQDIRGKLSKLTGHVAFEELLDLTRFQGSRESGESCVYRLVGVVEHSGTLRGGHYVAYVRVDSPDAKLSFWYCLSDSSVWPSTLEKVLRSEAYLLFYERV